MSYFQARLAEVQIPPKKPQKYLFHVPRTLQSQTNHAGSSGFLLCSKICMVSGIFALPYPVPHRPAGFFTQTETMLRIFRLNVQGSVPGSGGKN